ncbi:MAG: ligase-associated DNA damage response endonuclease PdeM [Rubrivivax sp.]
MSVGVLNHGLAEGPVQLLADRAAFLPEQGMLMVADVHLGKAQAFRRLGVPVPEGTTWGNLQRLSALVAQTQARELVFLGDLLHARHGRSAALDQAFVSWRNAHAGVAMRLVRGNHDSRAGDPPARWGIELADEPWRCGPWALCHHPQVVAGAYTFAGHLHPGVRLGRGADRLRLPCFHLLARHAVLPAFGEFTGLHLVQPEPGEGVAVVAHGAVRWLAGHVPSGGGSTTSAASISQPSDYTDPP